MRRIFQGSGFIFLILIIVLAEYYTFTALRFSLRHAKPSTKHLFTYGYLLITVLWIGSFFLFPSMRSGEMNKTLRNFLICFTMGFLITKLLIGAVLLIDDLRRFIYYIGGAFFSKENVPDAVTKGMSRSEFFNTVALMFGGSVFAALIYGMTNRYNYHIRKQKLVFSNLPNAFHGMKVVQISDIHSGSLNNPEAILKGITTINNLQPDVIFFTGDLVNNKSEEMQPFMEVFNKLQAKHGVYSILGNHDYGDYVPWNSEEEKVANLTALKNIHKELGWKLLLNEHITLEEDGEHIAVIGVENTSFRARFHSYGDMAKAYAGSEKYPFKILLSHDPSHWDGEVNSKYTDVDLTLSGHTHGMQFGIEIPWLKWSPVQYMYKQWAGLYSKNNQHIYVNRGFGFLGYPGRVGILPEITLFELATS
jgi:uncharacterized protein